jgi:ATP-dependent Clp protease ATP-binding subunit ClpC
MLSRNIQHALEREVIGQPRAVRTLMRAATVGFSGIRGDHAPAGMFLLLGPTGTGKTHMARSLVRVLHGDTRRLVVVDCMRLQGPEDWQTLVAQLAPFFTEEIEGHEQAKALPPLSVLLVEHLEAARPEFIHGLMSAFERGCIGIPGGVGSLRSCLILLTSRVCSREIYGEDRQEIGFHSSTGDIAESEKQRIYKACCETVEKFWGNDFLGHIDDLIIFHRLREPHLPAMLERELAALNNTLEAAQVRVELEPAAAELLIDRSAQFLRHGAWYLGKIFRRFVLFPVADLASSERLSRGSCIVIRLDGERLCFTVTRAEKPAEVTPTAAIPEVRIPVAWEETAPPTP